MSSAFGYSFPIGSTVVAKDDPSRKGTVVSNQLSDSDYVAVEWKNGDLEKVYALDIKVYTSTMEADYRKIKEKVDEATKLLTEAGELANSHDTTISSLNCELDLNRLYEVMNGDGWYNSSRNC